jgi:hypothetical protein
MPNVEIKRNFACFEIVPSLVLREHIGAPIFWYQSRFFFVGETSMFKAME